MCRRPLTHKKKKKAIHVISAEQSIFAIDNILNILSVLVVFFYLFLYLL